MQQRRRDVLATGAALATVGLAGCNGLSDDDDPDAATETESGDGSSADGGASTEMSEEESDEAAGTASAEVAVAAEWNAMRARVWDALSLGLADETAAGAAVTESTFARFEGAGGEYGAHEMLEHTSEEQYEGFEEALGELGTAGLDAGDIERTREEATLASTSLAEAQRTLVGDGTAAVFDLQLLGTAALDAAALAGAGHFDGARAVAEAVFERFEEAPVHEALEDADAESYEAFEGSVEAAASAAEDDDADAVREEAAVAYQSAIDGSYALADSEVVAGAGHVATLQARG